MSWLKFRKCKNVECKWHMGYGYKTYTYLNGKCYFSDDNYEGNCPINFKSKRKEKSSDSEDK